MSREDPLSPRSFIALCALTKESRSSRYEVLCHVWPWLNLQSYANVQAIGSVGHHELTDRRGRFEAEVVTKIKDALRWVFDL